MSQITLSPQHGVNPSVGICFYCLEESDLLLFGKLPGDIEAPRRNIWHMDPCSKCKALMDRGIILIEVRSEEDMQQVEKARQDYVDKVSRLDPIRQSRALPFIPNPYRSGGWWVVTEDAVNRLFDKEMAEWARKHRWMFILQDAAIKLGLPRPGADEPPDHEFTD